MFHWLKDVKENMNMREIGNVFFFKKELKMKITLDDIYGNFDTTYKLRKFENTAINLFRIKHRGKKLSSPWHAPGQNTGVGSLSPTRLK